MNNLRDSVRYSARPMARASDRSYCSWLCSACAAACVWLCWWRARQLARGSAGGVRGSLIVVLRGVRGVRSSLLLVLRGVRSSLLVMSMNDRNSGGTRSKGLLLLSVAAETYPMILAHDSCTTEASRVIGRFLAADLVQYSRQCGLLNRTSGWSQAPRKSVLSDPPEWQENIHSWL